MSLDLTTPTDAKWLSLTHASVPTLATNMTVAFWARTQAWTASVGHIYEFGEPAGSPEANWGMRTRATDQYEMSGGDGTGAPALTTTASPTTLNLWTLIVAGYDTTFSRYITINGETNTNNTSSTSFNPVPATPNKIVIGADIDITSGFRYDGYIAEWCVWNKLLTDAEQQSLYVSSETGVYPNQVAAGNIIHYVPLISAVTATVGQDFVDNGTVSWASGVHPTMQNIASDMVITTSGAVVVDSSGNLLII